MKKSVLIFVIAAMSFSLRAQTEQTYTQMISDSKIQDSRLHSLIISFPPPPESTQTREVAFCDMGATSY
ncbi:hypothetical protein LJC53_07000 [Bacteroidales bacterium OttesenSCG-928-C03]|nr:hypothetical protein [Bacteroidales bacterium OttesenSCG-928-C03]